MPSPTVEARSPWNEVELAGQKLPGYWTVSGSRQRVRLIGRTESAKQWRALLPILDGLRACPDAVSISTMALDLIGIRSVKMANIGTPRPIAPAGVDFMVELDLRPVWSEAKST